MRKVRPSCLHLSVGRRVTSLAAAVVTVVGAQAGVLHGAVGAAGGHAAAAVGMTQTLTVLLVDLQHAGKKHIDDSSDGLHNRVQHNLRAGLSSDRKYMFCPVTYNSSQAKPCVYFLTTPTAVFQCRLEIYWVKCVSAENESESFIARASNFGSSRATSCVS